MISRVPCVLRQSGHRLLKTRQSVPRATGSQKKTDIGRRDQHCHTLRRVIHRADHDLSNISRISTIEPRDIARVVTLAIISGADWNMP